MPKKRIRQTLKIYIPAEAGDLSSEIDTARKALGVAVKRKITMSEFVVLAVREKLERDQ